MKLTLLRSDLMSALTLAAKAVSPKPTMPVLSHVLLAADPAGTLRASATDLARSVVATVPAQVSRGGSVALPSALLASQVGAMPDGEVTISVDEKATATLTASKRKVRVIGMSGEDFPTVKIPAEPLCTLKADAFATLIRRVQHALSEDDTRPHLQSLHLVARGDTLHAEAAEGHVLCLADAPAAGVGTWEALLHKGSLPALHAALGAAGESSVMLRCERATGKPGPLRALSVTHAGISVSAKTTDADYPSFASVTEGQSQGERGVVIDDPRALLSILSGVGGLSGGGGVILSLEGDTLSVSAESMDRGEARDELSVNVTGAAGPEYAKRFGMNLTFLSNALRAAGPSATLWWRGEFDAVYLTSESGVDLMMPMRV